jgi:hypothetical protein
MHEKLQQQCREVFYRRHSMTSIIAHCIITLAWQHCDVHHGHFWLALATHSPSHAFAHARPASCLDENAAGMTKSRNLHFK